MLALTLSKVRLGDEAGERESLRLQGQKQSPRCMSLMVRHGELALTSVKARLGEAQRHRPETCIQGVTALAASRSLSEGVPHASSVMSAAKRGELDTAAMILQSAWELAFVVAAKRVLLDTAAMIARDIRAWTCRQQRMAILGMVCCQGSERC